MRSLLDRLVAKHRESAALMASNENPQVVAMRRGLLVQIGLAEDVLAALRGDTVQLRIRAS